MTKLLRVCVLAGFMLTASTAIANTTASSTMHFFSGNQDALQETAPGSGVYVGTIPMSEGYYYLPPDGPGTTFDTVDWRWETPDGEPANGGFDIYAREGAWATYDKVGSSGQEYAVGQIGNDHDAYSTAGGWGVFYSPDCADWYNYQLKLTATSWSLEYNANVGIDLDTTGATSNPMSGVINWTTMVATETGTGAYYTGMGTAESPGYAASFASSKGQSTAGAWDMDWSWGSDYVPLEHSNFAVSIYYGPGSAVGWHVTLTPVPAPGAILLGSIGVGLVGWLRRRRML